MAPPPASTTSWTQQGFHKDGRLRYVERYRRKESLHTLHGTLIIPNGVVWRQYLGVFRYLSTLDIPVRLVLTESAVELMDTRNMTNLEAAVPRERQTLIELVQEHGVLALPDLSLRWEHDEWEVFAYETMDTNQRSHQAQMRLAERLIGATCWLVVDESTKPFAVDSERSIRNFAMDTLLTELAQLLNAHDYVQLQEIAASCKEAYAHRNNKDRSDDAQIEYTADSITAGLKSGDIMRGRLNVTKENIAEAFVMVSGTALFIPREHFRGAFHQDIVFVEKLPESQWRCPVGRKRLVHHRENDEDIEDDTDELIDSSTVPTARVVGIDKPGRRDFIATMVDQPNPDDSAVQVVPMDIRIPKIRIRTRSWQRFVGVRLRVEVIDWEATSKYPTGRCVQIMGDIGNLETEVRSLLIENQVELDPFSSEALACLPAPGWTVTAADMSCRRDLRTNRRIFSVDPPGCQDIDDTMHAEVLPNGDIEVGVHIADVTAFVKHNSALDLEAQARGTTFYLVDRRFDMLPSILSSDLCSLHGNIDRLAVSVIWVFSSDFEEVKSTWYGRSVIHNCAAMTYDQADNILAGKPPEEPGKEAPPPLTAGGPVNRQLVPSLKTDLAMLTNLTRKLRKRREDLGGAVDLSSGDSGSELKFTLVDGIPQKVTPKKDKEIHHTIAELMILANTFVAETIHNKYPQSALLRVHRSVEESRLRELRELMASAGIELEGSDGLSLSSALNEARAKYRKGSSSLQTLLLSIATRAMTEAQYVSTGDEKGDSSLTHFGLGLGKYTHFTSPIRRYADVVVHKQLLSEYCDNGAIPTSVGVNVAPLKAVPDSEMVSILAGEGLQSSENATLREAADAPPHLTTEGQTITRTHRSLNESPDSNELYPYEPVQVTTICEGLNLHNRLAKQSSFECQGLFLSLYFKDNVEETDAIVTNVRENGFFVYIPKYDMRGPVYVRDVNGDVQMDPGLLGLSRTAGHAPTLAFKKNSQCRRFPEGRCTLHEDCLEVSVGGTNKPFVVRPLDVVTVQLSCDQWDVRARVPTPMIQLQSKHSRTTIGGPVRVTTKSLTEQPTRARSETGEESKEEESPILSVLANLKIQPTITMEDLVHVKTHTAPRTQTISGRWVFGDFVNPDTRSAKQEIAQLAAAEEIASQHTNHAAATNRRNEYDNVRQIERAVTSRQQRLAADKRNTRKSKAK